MANPKSNFDSLSSSFLASFKSQSGANFHPDLQLTDLRSRRAGRGIVAQADIPADTDLFVIPRSYVISVENSQISARIPELFYDDDGVGDETVEDAEEALVELPKPWLDLILVMLYEYFHRGTSKWGSYWDVLPETFDTLMFWTSEELAELQASAAREKIGKEDADAMFRKKILPAVKAHEDVFYPEGAERLSEEELLRLAHRMGSLIMAYAFDLEKDPGEMEEEDEGVEDGWAEDREGKMAMGMVPMADMLNADAEFNAHLEHGESHLTMRSLREIKKGEEVLNYYGPLPSSDLLRRYGYTSLKHTRFDVVEIGWDLILNAMEAVLGSALEFDVDNDKDMEESFVLERESGDPDETGTHKTEAKFKEFPEELVDQVTVFVSATLGIVGKSGEERKRTLKRSFLQIMARVLSDRLDQYETTIQQDEDLIRDESVAGRQRMAIDVRLGEKRLLKEAEHVVAELLVKYSNIDSEKNGSRSEPPSKKQKTRR